MSDALATGITSSLTKKAKTQKNDIYSDYPFKILGHTFILMLFDKKMLPPVFLYRSDQTSTGVISYKA